MSLWSREIAGDEPIVRGICSPYHVKKGKVQPRAYQSPPDMDEVSVMRLAWIGADVCKRKAQGLEDRTVTPPKIYAGVAVLSAAHIRENGAQVVDTREEFEGHADIQHGIIRRRDDPLPPEQLRMLNEQERALAKLAIYYADNDPSGTTWTGPELRYR